MENFHDDDTVFSKFLSSVSFNQPISAQCFLIILPGNIQKLEVFEFFGRYKKKALVWNGLIQTDFESLPNLE